MSLTTFKRSEKTTNFSKYIILLLWGELTLAWLYLERRLGNSISQGGGDPSPDRPLARQAHPVNALITLRLWYIIYSIFVSRYS